MMKETGTVQVHQEAQSSADFLTEALQKFMERPTGLQFAVEGLEGPAAFFGGKVTKVKVDSAWIGFTIGECMFRTKTTADMKTFWEWVLRGGWGNLTALFQKSCGCTACKHLNRPAQEEKKRAPFVPRSRYDYGKANTRRYEISVEE